MAVAKDKDRIVVTIPKDVKDSLEKLAEEDGRSLSNYAAQVLKRHVEEAQDDGRES